MNTPDIQRRITELQQLIAQWANEKKILNPDEVIEVEICIKKPEKVSVKIEGYHGVADPDLINMKDLDLSVRATNCLLNANLQTVGQIRRKTLEEMLSYRSTGKKVLREIHAKISRLGVKLDWQIN